MRIALASALSAGIVAAGATQPGAPPILISARQMVLVVTPDWNSVEGELRRFERASGGQPWRPLGDVSTIVVGRSGTAWDSALTRAVPGPQKAEGDGRAPAGVFSLGKAFGYAPAAEADGLKLPYLPVVEGIECVDDSSSAVYNQIVDRRKFATPDWTSSEKMREVGEAYRWGVVVGYNTAPVVPKRGSCIFLHVGGSTGTAGCTAMSIESLRVVMAWLDPAAHPVLVQLPREAYQALKAPWALP